MKMMGFSACGHLAAAAGTMFDGGHADSNDTVERASDRPDFIILGYPWLNAMKPDQKGILSYCSALKIEPESGRQGDAGQPSREGVFGEHP